MCPDLFSQHGIFETVPLGNVVVTTVAGEFVSARLYNET